MHAGQPDTKYRHVLQIVYAGEVFNLLCKITPYSVKMKWTEKCLWQEKIRIVPSFSWLPPSVSYVNDLIRSWFR